MAEVGNKIGAELLKPHLLRTGAARFCERLGFGVVAYYRRRTSEELPRVLPSGVAQIDFVVAGAADLQISGQGREMESDALLESFNLGVGMVLVVPSAYEVEADLKRRREKFSRVDELNAEIRRRRVVYSGALNL